MSTTTPISPLRRRMIEDMTVRGFGEKTQSDYIRHVKNFTIFLGRSPDTAEGEDLRVFQVRQREQGVQPPTMNGAVAALRFFFTTTCNRPEMARHLRLVKQPQKLRRRQLRQRSRRDDQRALQSRGDPSAWTLALLGGRRVRHTRMGRLVQQPQASRTDRQRTAGRGRSRPLRSPGGTCSTRSLTQTKRPPKKSVRFTTTKQ